MIAFSLMQQLCHSAMFCWFFNLIVIYIPTLFGLLFCSDSYLIFLDICNAILKNRTEALPFKGSVIMTAMTDFFALWLPSWADDRVGSHFDNGPHFDDGGHLDDRAGQFV